MCSLSSRGLLFGLGPDWSRAISFPAWVFRTLAGTVGRMNSGCRVELSTFLFASPMMEIDSRCPTCWDSDKTFPTDEVGGGGHAGWGGSVGKHPRSHWRC